MSKSKPLVPLWALVIGPFWIPILLLQFLLLAIVSLLWIIPVAIACDIFGWEMPRGLGWFGDEYEVMP